MKRWQGSKDLLFDAIEETTNLVERTHASVARKSFRPLTAVAPIAPWAKTVQAVHDTVATGSYAAVRGVSRGVGKLLDAGTDLVADRLLDAPEAAPSATQASRARLIDNAEGAVNGFWGDYLSQRQNGLDLGMTLRHQGQVLPVERAALTRAYPPASGRLAVFIHGLSSTEWSWNSSAERFHGDPDVSFGSLLQADLGFTPLYVRYNSGQHISHNSRLLSALLAQLVAEYPVAVEEIALIGHSMGGLVARSAAFRGQTDGEPWVRNLRHIFCLGTPNLGAPLEQSVNLLTSVLGAVDTAGTQVPAQVLKTRSAGIKDLRFGYTLDEEWQGKDPDALLKNYRQDVPLVDGVGYYFVAATLTEDAGHPLGLLLGDLLVRPPSAAGHASQPARRIPFHAGQTLNGLNHFHLTNHPQVYAVIRQCIEASQPAADTAGESLDPSICVSPELFRFRSPLDISTG